MRDKLFILSEIKRTATQNGGKPVGMKRFQTETGIAEHEWRGSYWARWGDAVSEAGFAPLEWNTGLSVDTILGLMAKIVRQYGRYPTFSEILIEKKNNEQIPTPRALSRKLGPKADAIVKVRVFCSSRPEYSDVFAILANETNNSDSADEREYQFGLMKSKPAGYIYMVKSGKLYKIGCSENHWRRKSELHKQTSEGITEIHTISAIDDAPGIEKYWHNRFQDKRRHGEWFDLSPEDIRAFKKRKSM